jgi:transposase
MSIARKKYSSEFKTEAVSLVTVQGLSLVQAARDLGINSNMLHRWKQEIEQHAEKAFPGNGLPIEQELASLRREVATLKREREILKKATIFFAQHAPENEPHR